MIKSGVAELRHGTARHPRRHGASESTTRDRMKPSLGRVWRETAYVFAGKVRSPCRSATREELMGGKTTGYGAENGTGWWRRPGQARSNRWNDVYLYTSWG